MTVKDGGLSGWREDLALEAQGGDEFFVGGKPLNRRQFGRKEPTGRLVLLQGERTVRPAKETMHGQMECRVVVLHRSEEFADDDFGIQFLANLAYKCLLRRLSGLDFSTRELPPVLPLAVSPLSGKDAAFGITNNSCSDSNGFHFTHSFWAQSYNKFFTYASAERGKEDENTAFFAEKVRFVW